MRFDALRDRRFRRTLRRRRTLPLYRNRPPEVSRTGPNRASLSVVAIAAILTAGLLIGVSGCDRTISVPPPRPAAPPLVEESYAIDDVNRPLTNEELDEAAARLASDPDAFVAELEQAPPVRQASLIFVLQQSPAVARERRDLLEKLSASEHGIVRRAALFALEAAEE